MKFWPYGTHCNEYTPVSGRMPATVICTPSLTDTDTSTGATTPGTVVVVVLVVVGDEVAVGVVVLVVVGDEVAVGVVVVVVVSAVGANRQRNPRVLVCTHVNPRPETPSRAVAPPRTHTAPSAGAALACFTP